MAAMEEEEAQPPSRFRAPHIKKRALKNKALSVSFSEKDLTDYVTGFHKRKKKRRKEAQQKLQEAERRKRIEARKKRKLEREFVMYGGAPPNSTAEHNESGEDGGASEDEDPIPSVSGMATYDSGDVRVTVTTSEITREEEEEPNERPQIEAVRPQLVGGSEKQKQNNLPVTKKKQFKKVAKKRSHPKPQSKRDKRKGKKKNNKSEIQRQLSHVSK